MAKGNFIKKTLEVVKRKTARPNARGRPQRFNKNKPGCGLRKKPTAHPRRTAGGTSTPLPEEHQPARHVTFAEPLPKPEGDGPPACRLKRKPTPIPTREAKEVRGSVALGTEEAAGERAEVEAMHAHLKQLDNPSSRNKGSPVSIVAQGFEVERDLAQSPPAKEVRPEGPWHISILESLPKKPRCEGQSGCGGLKRKPTPIPSRRDLGLPDITKTIASACFTDKHRYAWHVDALRKRVDSQLQPTNNNQRLRLPGPEPSPLSQAYVLPESEVDYEADIPSHIGYIWPLSAGDLRSHDIGSGLRRVPTPIPGVGGI